MTREASSPECPAPERSTYIGLLREEPTRPTCCSARPDTTRAYTCTCGQRWRLTQDGWIKVGYVADGDRLSPREA